MLLVLLLMIAMISDSTQASNDMAFVTNASLSDIGYSHAWINFNHVELSIESNNGNVSNTVNQNSCVYSNSTCIIANGLFLWFFCFFCFPIDNLIFKY